jgi:acyl carrier protein
VVLAQETVPTLLRELVGAGDGARTGASVEHPALAELAATGSYAERVQLLEQLLRVETGRVLKLAPERIGANQPFGQLGIDSLMALELVRRVNAALGLALPATAVFNYPTLTQLAAQILTRLGLDAVAESPVAVAVVATHAVTDRAAKASDAAKAEELSEEEALRALMEPGEASGGH